MLQRVFHKQHTSHQIPADLPTQAGADKASLAKRSPRGPAVLGDGEVWVKNGVPTPSSLVPQSRPMELVPPTRGEKAKQGCWFSQEVICCIPCLTFLNIAQGGMKGCICLIPCCFN